MSNYTSIKVTIQHKIEMIKKKEALINKTYSMMKMIIVIVEYNNLSV